MSSEQLTNLRVTNRMILPIWTNLATINGQSLIELRESIDINTYMPPADANYGDITVSGGGTVWTINPLVVSTGKIANNAVTFAKIQTISTDSLLGRDTAGTGNVENIGINTTLSMDGAGNLQRSALTGDITASAGSNTTVLATVNLNVGTFGSATKSAIITVNGKGLITSASDQTITPAIGSITGFGTGVATALGVNIGIAGAVVVNGGALGTPSSGTATNLTGTASGLTAGNVTTNANLTGPITSVGNATSIASQTGTGTKFVVDNTPTLITPILGVASATSLNTGTTLNGTIFAKSANLVSLSSTNHALTAGNEATGINIALGLYSTSFGVQARNNGVASNIFMNPLGGSVAVGDGALTGQRIFLVNNTGAGTGDWSSIEVRNGTSSTEALRLYCLGTGFTTSGMNKQDYGVVSTGTAISGMSIGTQASAPIEFYTNNALRTTIDANGYTKMTNRLATAYASVASANNLTLTTGNVFGITGTTQITAITNTNWQAGSQVILIFAGVLTVKNNTAGGAGTSTILLAGGVDFATTANDVLMLVYNGTNWVEVSRSIN